MYNFLLFSLCICSITIQCTPSNTDLKQSIKDKQSVNITVNQTLANDSLIFPDYTYPWLEDVSTSRLCDISPNTGFERQKTDENSFSDWLRYIPLKSKTEKVRYFDGQIKPNQQGVFRVLDIDVGKRDLQQCADAVMRLRAEYLYATQQYQKIHFNYTNGVTVRYDDWVKGRKPYFKNGKTYFSTASSEKDYSYNSFKKYMTSIFIYAGSSSLEKELNPVGDGIVKAGDVFIQGGFPGHAIIILDVTQSTDGKQQMLLAQSYMPAQSIHILKNPVSNDGNPWFDVLQSGELNTPDWLFYFKEDHYRFQ